MKKTIIKAISIILASVLCFTLVPVPAVSANSDFTIVNGVLTKYNGAGGHAVIPNGVTSIGVGAFRYNINLTGVTIPNSVRSIDSGAFVGTGLTSVTIPNSVTSIGNQAFASCRNLTSVTLGSGVRSIGPEAFSGAGLTSITIPNNVTSIGELSFSNNKNLISITIGSGITIIPPGAFVGNSCLKSVTMPSSVTSIEFNAFKGSTSLESITIGSGVKRIGPCAFMESENLRSVILPNGLESIGYSAFDGCTNLANITIPNSVKSIELAAFMNCTSLTSINIPDSVTSIESFIFANCTSLRSVTLGSGLTSISGRMFSNCTSLTSIVIPDGVTSIGISAFAKCTSLTSATIPASVTEIRDGAFNYDVLNESRTSVTYYPLDKLTIYGVPGSAAETLAKQWDYPFMTIGSAASPPSTSRPASNTPSTWAQPHVTAAINSGLVPTALQSAYTQATTRAEFCALAVRLYESLRGEITGRLTFSDTNDVNVQKAAAIGVVEGVGGNRFSPNRAMTREEAATMLARLAQAAGRPLTKRSASFADNGTVALWALDAVGQMQASGIMEGTGNNRFSPRSSYTREQSITTILRMFAFLTNPALEPTPIPIPPPIAVLPISESLKRGMTDAEFQQAYAVATEIASKYAGQSREDQLRGVYQEIRHIFDTEITYSMTEKHYNTVYGYFVAGVASCAGAVRATGLVLTILGFEYEHVNENQASHQWPRVNLDGRYWIVDAFMLYVGPEPAPYEHPWFD